MNKLGVRGFARNFVAKRRKYIDFLLIFREFLIDYRRYLTHGVPEHNMELRLSPKFLEMQTIMDIHSVEKGLSLRETRHPFGAEVIGRLTTELANAPSDFYWKKDLEDSKKALMLWNEEKLKSEQVVVQMKRNPEDVKHPGPSILETRHSVRSFDCDLPVPDEILIEAVRVAYFAPSVCNRQAWNVIFAKADETKNSLLALQNGNSGFSGIPVVGVITVDISLFTGAGERNQPWIDGGIFAMSLSVALHGMGLGSCLLNTSVRNNYSDKIREIADIPDGHLIISMMAIGFSDVEYMKAKSSRRDVKDVLKFL